MNKNELNQTKGITNMVSKGDSNKYKDIIESALTIIGVSIFAFIAAFICHKVMSKDIEPELTIGTNNAESNLYDANYDAAISSYESEKDKEKTEWPMYKVKEAEVYSLKGDYTYSNRLLSEAYDTRNELIRKNGIEKYKEEDKELGNLIVFTALMNGDTEKALEYGEIFFLDDDNNKQLDETMFTVYLANGKKDEAGQILEQLDYDDSSAYELSQVAYMNFIMNDYDKAITYLKDAYEIDKDEVKIYDVIEDMMASHSEKLISKLKNLSKKYPDEVYYKVWLAKCYSLNKSTAKDAQKLLDELRDKNFTSVVYKVIEADTYKNLDEVDKYNDLMEEIIEDEDDNYYGKYLAAKYAFENKEYSKGIEYAKESIIDNRDYIKVYTVVMPELLYASKESEKAESYFRTAFYKEPFNYNTLINIADYCRKVQQDSDKSLKYYNLALAMSEDNAEVYYNMAISKISLTKNNEAISLLEKAIKINDKEAKYYRKLGEVYLANKDSDKAIKTIRKAYDINSDDINTLNDAGYYYISVGEADRAKTNFKAAYEGINDSTDISVKNAITKNYEKVKEYLDNKNTWTKSSIEDFKYLD